MAGMIFTSATISTKTIITISTTETGTTESGASHFRHYSRFSMGNDVADYNNDGQPDIVTVDMLPPDEKNLKHTAVMKTPISIK